METVLVSFKESRACYRAPLIFLPPHNGEDQDDFSGWQRLYDWLGRAEVDCSIYSLVVPGKQWLQRAFGLAGDVLLEHCRD